MTHGSGWQTQVNVAVSDDGRHGTGDRQHRWYGTKQMTVASELEPGGSGKTAGSRMQQ